MDQTTSCYAKRINGDMAQQKLKLKIANQPKSEEREGGKM
jgi:hypothetical protein